MSGLGRNAFRLARELALPVVLVIAWWLWSTSSRHLYYPPAPEVLRVFRDTWFGYGFSRHVVPSLQNLFVGYAVGAVAGVALGVAIGASRVLRAASAPLTNFLRSLPPPALLPVFILVAGIGWIEHAAFIAFGVLFPVLMNTIDGIAGVDMTVRDVVRVYRVRPLHRLVRVTLPAASPAILAGLRVGLSLAVLLMVVGELVASNRGIGYFLLNAQGTFDLTAMWAGIIFVAIVSYLFNLAFVVLIENRILFWQRQRSKRAVA